MRKLSATIIGLFLVITSVTAIADYLGSDAIPPLLSVADKVIDFY